MDEGRGAGGAIERHDGSHLASGCGALSAIGLLTVMVYASVVGHGAIYDDPAWTARMVPDWHPIANLALWSFNLQTYFLASLGALHLGNLAIHLLNGGLVYLLARRFSAFVAVLAAFIFLLHPIQREAVNYISGRPDLLSTTLLLLALLCALRSPRWYLPGLICCALAVTTKPSAIVGVPLCLLSLAILLRREREVRALWWMGLGLTAITCVAFGPIAFATFLQPPLVDLIAYAGHQAAAVWRLLALVIVPYGFSIDHDYAWVTLWPGLLALVALGCAVRSLWGRRRTQPTLAWAGLFAILAVAPRFLTLGAYPIGPEITEPQLYLSFVGVSIGCAALCEGVL